MSEEANKAMVRRYFVEVLDGRKFEVARELFATDGTRHFPGRDIASSQTAPENVARSFATIIHHLLADGDFVLAHITHTVTYEPGAGFLTRLGRAEAGEKTVTWTAMALFHFRDGKIDEEWVNRDELDVLQQLGAVALTKG
jgi:predicted SnoaL-like aldol condensation-catalyzing enzyme